MSMMGLNVSKYIDHTAPSHHLVVPRSESITSQTQSSCFVLSLEHLKQSSQSPPAQRGSGGKKHATGAEQEQGNTNMGWLDIYKRCHPLSLKNGQSPGDGILVSSLGMSDEKSHDVHE